MKRRYLLIFVALCMGLFLASCSFFDSEAYWIRENTPVQSNGTEPATVPVPTETVPEIPVQLQINPTIVSDGDLRFQADTKALINDLGVYLQRQLGYELWQQTEEASTPYSRTPATYRRMEFDLLVKNEPLLCVYTSETDALYEITAIVLTHDWTEAGENQFLQLGNILLRCFWPDCNEETILQTVDKIQADITQNIYPNQTAELRPIAVYVNGNAAAYGYTHAAHISINVIPVDENRLQELVSAGIPVHYIS